MSRVLRRHHRARVIRNRANAAIQVWGEDWPHHWPIGALADNQYWMGCNRARCGLCHPWKRWSNSADRTRAEREWRREWGV
jgi:hypothetical protein